MTGLFGKLNLGTHARITVLDAPPTFEAELEALHGVAVERAVRAPVAFAIAFAATVAARDAHGAALAAASEGDAILWMAYPKRTSNRFACEFNRDSGWPTLDAAGFEPVRMVAIDEDWSALRFRRSAFVATR